MSNFIAFLIASIVGLLLFLAIVLNDITTNYVLIPNKYIVQQDYGYYDSNKELVIRDEFKKYYEEVK